MFTLVLGEDPLDFSAVLRTKTYLPRYVGSRLTWFDSSAACSSLIRRI